MSPYQKRLYYWNLLAALTILVGIGWTLGVSQATAD
jgi:hypothetical protein